MILLLDNYDSFTYNIVQYLQQLGAKVVVYNNDAITVSDILELNPDAIVLGPGPGKPDEAGITLDCVQYFANKLPMLGICLGHQAIAQAFGASIIRAPQIMHGRTSVIYHHQAGVFAGLASPTEFTRYHSLIVDKDGLPDCFEVSAWTSQSYANTANFDSNGQLAKVNEIMAIKHKTLPIEGVQFHPESILSHDGITLLNNFLTQHQLI